MTIRKAEELDTIVISTQHDDFIKPESKDFRRLPLINKCRIILKEM